MKRKWIFIVFTLYNYLMDAQTSLRCDSLDVYSVCFDNFVNYNDSVKYSFKAYLERNCVIDTTELIKFLVNKNNCKGQFGNRIPSNVINSSLALNTTFKRLSSGIKSNNNTINTLTDTLPLNYYSGRIHETFPISSINKTSKELFIYFIYSLYKADFEFAKVIKLTDGKHFVEIDANIDKLNTVTYRIKNRYILNKGLRSIIKWRRLVSMKGLNYVRNNNIDPLFYSKLKWAN